MCCRYMTAVRVLDWQAAAVAACRRSELQDIVKLQCDLAGRALEFTGEAVDFHSIYVDRDARSGCIEATCSWYAPVHCGSRRFESAAVRDLVNLRYALSVWEPRCEACAPEDEDWSHSF